MLVHVATTDRTVRVESADDIVRLEEVKVVTRSP